MNPNPESPSPFSPKPFTLAEMRRSYTLGGLLESDVDADPMVQFRKWFDEAGQDIPEWIEVNAMTLSTCDFDGSVTARIVLLKGIEQRRFIFYSNYGSQKARQIAANPLVTASFYWPHLQRQIHIRGTAEKTDRETSRAYFHSRPRDSQLGAHVSEQSSTIDSRQVLEATMARLQSQYPEGTPIPLPENWGGYAITPSQIEFWQGRASRLHDRIVYNATDEKSWRISRRAP